MGRWGQQRGAAPAPPLDTATAVSDTLISSLDTVGFSVPRVALVLWHDQRYVWFVPKVAPSKHWVAKILVEVLVAHDLADIGKKNELELARVHWHAKKMATIQTKTNLWVMTKILVEVLVAHDLADIGKKNELELARVHWHAKKMATIQTKTNLWVMTKILVRCTLATIQTHPNTRLVEDARGAAMRPRSGVARPTASSGPETMPGRLAFSMTCGDRM